MSKPYFLYLIKTNLWKSGLIFLFELMLIFSCWNVFELAESLFIIILPILAVLLFQSWMLNRKESYHLLSFPISRMQLWRANLLHGLIQLILPQLLLFVLLELVHVTDPDPNHRMMMIFILLCEESALYFLYSTLLIHCQNKVDAALSMAAALFLPSLAESAISAFLYDNTLLHLNGYIYLHFFPEILSPLNNYLNANSFESVSFPIALIHIGLSAALLISRKKAVLRKKPEEIGGQTHSRLIYPFFLYSYGLFMMLFLNKEGFFNDPGSNVVQLLFLFLAYLFLIFLWKRDFHLSVSYCKPFVLLFLSTLLFQQIFIRCFSLSLDNASLSHIESTMVDAQSAVPFKDMDLHCTYSVDLSFQEHKEILDALRLEFKEVYAHRDALGKPAFSQSDPLLMLHLQFDTRYSIVYTPVSETMQKQLRTLYNKHTEDHACLLP